MASVHLCGPKVASAAMAKPALADGLRVPASSSARPVPTGRRLRGLVVRAATVVSPKIPESSKWDFQDSKHKIDVIPKPASFQILCRTRWQGTNLCLTCGVAWLRTNQYTSVKPLGDRVLVKTKTTEDKTAGGILLPTTAQSRPQAGEVVAVGEGRSLGSNVVEISVPVGAKVIYSKYAGTELEFNDTTHLIMKEDDIIGILDTDDVKDLKPLSDRILIKVAESEEETAGGLLLTQASKEKPSVGTVVAVGPGPLGDDGSRTPLSITPGSSVLYSKYAGSEFKGSEGEYIVLRSSDVIAVLSS
uniref:20 kDa chaperonin, chloroplastic n=1 Tax=Aegilops tauschii TaxID=37682 RepID=M8B0Y4_AEGTA